MWRKRLISEAFQFAHEYTDNILKLLEGTLRCLHYVLTMFPRASRSLPLEDKMNMLKLPCEVCLGEKDWVITDGGY